MKNLQNGRSMIEMLGVLAIIGVLSIGGLAGYTMAMNRHRANTIAEYVSRCAVVAQTQKATGVVTGDCSDDTLLNEPLPAGISAATVSGDLDNTAIALTWDNNASGTKTAFINRYSTSATVNPHIDSNGANVYFFAGAGSSSS